MSHKVAVIGLGRFGMELARQLASSGVEVIAIDRSGNLVDDIKDDVAVAVRLDSTDEAALRSQDVQNVDVCVVAVGENFEAALLTTVIAKNLNIPRVICRAQTSFHADIFRRIGADEVIQPETQAGMLLARRLANPQIEDFISLAEGFTLLELHAPRAFHGKTVLDLALRQQYHVNLVAIKRIPERAEDDATDEAPQAVIRVPQPNTEILPGDVLVLIGPDESLARLPKE
ncbi:MAG: TrkA family potassium uptake protein [Planctomycetaceae bacterium]